MDNPSQTKNKEAKYSRENFNRSNALLSDTYTALKLQQPLKELALFEDYQNLLLIKWDYLYCFINTRAKEVLYVKYKHNLS